MFFAWILTIFSKVHIVNDTDLDKAQEAATLRPEFRYSVISAFASKLIRSCMD